MNEQVNEIRRKLLKWIPPVITTVILPVHAQTSVIPELRDDPPKYPPVKPEDDDSSVESDDSSDNSDDDGDNNSDD